MRSLMHGYFRWFGVLNRFFIDNGIIFNVNTPIFGGAGPTANFFSKPVFSEKNSRTGEKYGATPCFFD